MFWCFGCGGYGILAPWRRIEPASPALEGKAWPLGFPPHTQQRTPYPPRCPGFLFVVCWVLRNNPYLKPGLPLWLRQKRIRLQCGKPGFDPQVEKIPWRRAWQHTPVFFLGKFHRQRSLAGYSQWGGKESDTTEAAELTPMEAELKKNYSLKKLYI